MRLLVVASDRMEFTGLLSHGATARAAVAVDWSREMRLGDHQLLLAANGVGRGRAAAAVDACLPGFRADAVLSVGFCGALAPELEIAEVVVATEVVGQDRHYPAGQPVSAPRHRQGVVLTAGRIADSAEEKRRLRQTGACVVEMEAVGVADRAQASGIPFYCIKSVTDLADETMANDFNQALRSDGHFDTISILGSTLREPWTRLPELFRLRKRCGQAARALGDFFADCRF